MDLKRDLAGALQASIAGHSMMISPTMPVRGKDPGFLVCLPIYKNQVFGGFVFGLFRFEDLKTSTLTQPAFATCRISLFEGEDFILGELPVEPDRERSTAESKIEFRGHLWRFLVEPRTSVLMGGRLPAMILWLGILLGGAAAMAMWGLQESIARTRMALYANDQLKAEITERQLAELNLRRSEKRLGQVLDSATGVSVIAFDVEGNITYFSKGAEHLLGCSSAEMLGKSALSEIHDPAELEARGRELQGELGRKVEGFQVLTAVPGRQGSECREWIYRRRDGSPRTVELMVTVLEDVDGGTTGYLGTAVDITERNRMERDLRESLHAEQKSQALLESAGRIARLGHWELELNGEGPRWSDITYGIHDVPPGTPISLRQALDFYHPEDRPMVAACVKEALEKGIAHEFEARVITPAGRVVWIYSRGETVRNEAGEIIAIHGIFQDIDERRKAADLLRQRNLDLEAATARAEAHARAKAEFLANMSHEIRTPLNAVLGMSEMLMDGELDARERELVETIHSSGDVLLGLINDILDFSKIESGQLDLEHIAVPLRDCVDSVLDLLAGQADRKRLEFMAWVDPALPAAVLGDPTRLRQVLVNLVSNAIKFTAAGEVLMELSLREREGASWLRAAVSDTGIGIPPEGMERLFAVFSQVDASMTRRFGGTGLGLAICQRLIQNMGGRIWAESEPGKGSTFFFEIPLLAVDAPAPPCPGLRLMEGRRLLIVDGNGSSRRILSQQTELWKMRPVTAGSIGEASDLLREGESFDFVLLDAGLPGVSSGSRTEILLSETRGNRKPAILLLSSREALKRGPLPAGVTGVVHKPLKPGALLHALRQARPRDHGPAAGHLQASPASETRPSDSPGYRESSLSQTGASVRTAARPPAPTGGEEKVLKVKPGELCPLRILVAEDNPVNQRVVALHLQRMGYEPVMVGNGLEAVHAVRRGGFHVVLMDVQMPEMDGLEAARVICRHEPAKERPWIIALTANAFGSDREECLAAGMNDYLSKPVRGESLRRALLQAFEETCGGRPRRHS